MKNNNYASFFKTKPKKVERYIRCRKCGENMEWVEYYPPEIRCQSADIQYILSLMNLTTMRLRIRRRTRNVNQKSEQGSFSCI